MASQTHAPTSALPDAYAHTRDDRSGWLTFAAVLFIAASAVNALYGISALAKDDYFAVDELLFGDLSLWGVLYLCVAVTQVTTAVLILRRSMAGAFIGIGLALVSGFIALLSIAAFPLWSCVVLILDGLIIYALTVHAPVAD